MTITDKEKLEWIGRIVNDIKLKLPKSVDYHVKQQLDQIKDVLKKRSLTDDQGYQEALELDEEERLVLLKKEEKLEAIKEMIDELGGRRSLLPMTDVLNKIEIMLKETLRIP